MIRIAATCVVVLLACKDERAKAQSVPVAPPVDEPPPPPEADLGRACKSDRDCTPGTQRCIAFDTAGHLHPRGEHACTRPCLDKRCPAGFVCSTIALPVTNAVTGKIETQRGGWCGPVRSAVLVDNMEPGKMLRWASERLDGAPIFVVLRDGTVRVVEKRSYDDNAKHDLAFAAANAQQGIAAFRELVARQGFLGPAERKKLVKQKLPAWPNVEPPTGEATAHELQALGHFLPPGLIKKLATLGVVTRAMWPAIGKLHVIDGDGVREIPLLDLAAFDAELAR
ncbi:MAG TPA: hypothetical protein VIV11_08755 [Kofleriaceae bacterium]